MDEPTILNWQRYGPTLTTSGQPREVDIAALADLGVRHVVNLALHSHPQALPDEAASVAAAGMRYTHIPVEFDAPQETDYARFRELMDARGDEPMHVHCIVNARVTAFMNRYRRERGCDAETARAEMERVWRPGGVWARFIGTDDTGDHLYAGRHY